MEKPREIKGVSFSMVDDFERGLYEYATAGERGSFSKYVKRLIERDRAGAVRPVSASPSVVSTEYAREDDREASDLAALMLR